MNTLRWKKPARVAGAVAGALIAVGTVAFAAFLPRISELNEKRIRNAEDASSQWVRAQIEFAEGRLRSAEKLSTELELGKGMNSSATREFERANGCKLFRERPKTEDNGEVAIRNQ